MMRKTKNNNSQIENTVVGLEDFAVQNSPAQSHIQEIVTYLARETNKHKLNYRQLKYIFRSVRLKCAIDVPDQKSRTLYELPTSENLAQFYSSIDNPVHRLIFEVLEETGLRVAELCNLQVDRIDFKSNLGFVKGGKGNKDRQVVFGNHLLEKLKIYLQGRKNKYLFETNRHSKFSSRRIEQICQGYKAKAGITKNITPHVFRHLLFSRLAEANISKEKRMILAGHSSEKVQDIYSHLGIGGVKNEVIAILDKIKR